ncbi:MAG: efflux RND transporter periplasmic adaptor subunit [Gammaproteobacteria bacterium]|nr:efflux RND transporter periplasmic adaptor subunit [Gammaproteobacteria bacterium]
MPVPILPSRIRALALAAVFSVSCSGPPPPAEEIRPVRFQKVAASEFEMMARYPGEVRARHETALGFRVGGKVVERHVEVGSRVKPHDLLARLDPQDSNLNTQSITSQLAAAEADLNRAAIDLERSERLVKVNLVSKSDYDRQLNTYKAAQANHDQLSAQLKLSQNQAAYTDLRADYPGVITAIDAEVGQVVSAGQTVMRASRFGEKEIVINVPENVLDRLRSVQQIQVSLWANPARTYQGRIREVSPSADPVTRTYTVKVSVPDADDAMQLGMTASVAFSSTSGSKSVRLPLTALFQKEQQPAVWIVDETSGAVDLVPVEVDGFHDNAVTVTKGLSDGQLVVTAGVHKLHPGQKVRLLSTAELP